MFSEVPTTLRVIAASVRLIKERFMWADVMPVYRMLALSMAMLFTVALCLLLLLALAKTLSVVNAGQQLSNVAASGDVDDYGVPAPYIENLEFSSSGLNELKLKQGISPEQSWALADEALLMGSVDGQLGLIFCDALNPKTPCDARVECFDRAGRLTY